MKKISSILCFFVLLIIANDAEGQIAYYDAITLSNKANIAKDGSIIESEAVLKILANYINKPNPTKTDIENQFNGAPGKNPFIITSGGTKDLGNPFAKQSINNIASSVGDLDVTNIATGIADFLVERGKEELEVAFFDKIKTGLNTDAPELRVIFPKTSVLLDNFDTWQYSNILNALRESFNKDLQSILGDIINLDTVQVHKSYSADAQKRIVTMVAFFQKPESKILLSALEIGNGVITGVKMPAIVDSLATPRFLGGYQDGKDSLVVNAIRFIDVLSNSLRSENNTENYINPDTLIKSIHDTNFTKFYIGLVYQQLKNKKIKFRETYAYTLINTGANTIAYIKSLTANGKDITTAMDNLVAAKKKGEKDLSSYWSAIFQSSNQFLKALDNTEVIDSKLKFPTEVQNVFNYSTQTLTVVQDIATQNYNGALVSILSLVNDFTQKPISTESVAKSALLSKKQTLLDKSNARLKGIKKGDTNKTLNDSITKLNDTIKTLHTSIDGLTANKQDMADMLKGLVKYVALASNIVAAKSSDDVKKTIESFALPAGSYSIKRMAKENFAVQGYIGMSYDVGNPFGVDPSIIDTRNKYNMTFSLYAPVGFAYSLGSHCGCGSVTFFVPLIDVGGIADFRLHNDSATINQKITLESIFSPGLTVIYGVPKLPLSVSFGLVHKPALLFDAGQSSLVDITSVWRFNISLLIDIPILNISTQNF
jgi:hypothetical protein